MRTAAQVAEVVALHHHRKAASELGLMWRLSLKVVSVCIVHVEQHGLGVSFISWLESIVDCRAVDWLVQLQRAEGVGRGTF
jgi:hypothetical protein